MISTGWVDAEGDVSYENYSEVDDNDVMPKMREIAKQLSDWQRGTQARHGKSGLFLRDKYAVEDNPYSQFVTARRAVADDDVVGSAADILEALTFQELRWESSHEDSADVFNQLSETIDLDTYVRSAFRELFTFSQVTTAAVWGVKEFSLSAAPDAKAQRRKRVQVRAPLSLITLDPSRVVPVGASIFGPQRLCWNATQEELDVYEDPVRAASDLVMSQLVIGKPSISKEEEKVLGDLGIEDPDMLLELNPARVKRFTETKPTYARFADVRLRHTFRLLDLKQQLMDADRVSLVGTANYILLVKKGTDDKPALPAEVDNLRDQFRTVAKLPVLVSDHRLNIEIITPNNDYTLRKERYDILDDRIARNVFSAFSGSSGGGSTGDGGAQNNSRALSRRLENIRHMLRRHIESLLVRPVWDDPSNAQVFGRNRDDRPGLAFNPRNVKVDTDTAILQAVVQARQSRELSRESFLQFLGYDQSVEARRMEREESVFDDIFKTAVPFAAQQGDGGRPDGGGEPPQSVNGVKPQTSSGASKKEK